MALRSSISILLVLIKALGGICFFPLLPLFILIKKAENISCFTFLLSFIMKFYYFTNS